MIQINFSVSMCVYKGDAPEPFRNAVDSIINQTVRPDEIVLVVDGPIPSALDEIVTQYEKNALFSVIRLPKNVGHGNARRIGLKACSHELVALMDADDISLPDRFEKQLAIFESDPELTVVGGNIAEFLDETGEIVGYRLVPQTDKDIKNYMKTRCPMNQVTVMMKKSAVQAVGGFIDWYCEEDYYLWLHLFLADARLANLPDVLVNVRVGNDMYKRRGGWKYFVSEAKLQKHMLDTRIIGFGLYFTNVIKRLIVQVLLPNKLRAWAFQTFARESKPLPSAQMD